MTRHELYWIIAGLALLTIGQVLFFLSRMIG